VVYRWWPSNTLLARTLFRRYLHRHSKTQHLDK
jgi:hypothetical protein